MNLDLSFRLHRTVDNGAVFNVIVLIGSLISTVVVAFTMIMQLLEQYLGISTDEPSAQVTTGDQFTTAASIKLKMAGNSSAGDAKARDAASRFEKASSKYVDFDDDVAGAADREGGNCGDSDSVMGARPFCGNVVIQPSELECAIEMQNMSNRSSAAVGCVGDRAVATARASPKQNGDFDRDSQLQGMLADMRCEMRAMREQSTRSEAQLAFLAAQIARSDGEHAVKHEALKADLERKYELYDQKIQLLGPLPLSD
jgi:hypothetical protein